MSEVRKFLFEQSFDGEPKVLNAPDPMDALPQPVETVIEEVEPLPTFSEEEMQQARDQAFAAGKEEGLREAVGAAERRIADALELMGVRMVHVMDGLAKANEDATSSAVTVASGIVRKLLPNLSRRGAVEEVAAVVAEVMGRVLDEPRLLLRVDPEGHSALEARVLELARGKGYEGRVTVMGDPALVPGDCRIEWSNGGAERDMAALWQEVDAVIERNLGLSGDEDRAVAQTGAATMVESGVGEAG
ncbi:MAG: FliH/SctL family protein [Magnetospirillum sp. WYHS-4]